MDAGQSFLRWPTIHLPHGNIITNLIDPIRVCVRFWSTRWGHLKTSVFPEKSLWCGSKTTPSGLLPEDAMTNFMARSTHGITKLSIGVRITSCTLISTVATTLSTSLRTLSVIFTCVCIYTWEPLTEADWFALFEVAILLVMLYFQLVYDDCPVRS